MPLISFSLTLPSASTPNEYIGYKINSAYPLRTPLILSNSGTTSKPTTKRALTNVSRSMSTSHGPSSEYEYVPHDPTPTAAAFSSTAAALPNDDDGARMVRSHQNANAGTRKCTGITDVTSSRRDSRPTTVSATRQGRLGNTPPNRSLRGRSIHVDPNENPGAECDDTFGGRSDIAHPANTDAIVIIIIIAVVVAPDDDDDDDDDDGVSSSSPRWVDGRDAAAEAAEAEAVVESEAKEERNDSTASDAIDQANTQVASRMTDCLIFRSRCPT